MTAILVSQEDRDTAKGIVDDFQGKTFSDAKEAGDWLQKQITIALASAVTAAIAETIKPISKKRLAEIAAIADEDIDYSDIPEAGEDFFKRAKLEEKPEQ